MLPQQTMIEHIRALCREDRRVDAVMMYGSFVYGAGDAFSDIEFLLFFEDDAFADLDRRVWLEQIAPIDMMFVNDFGITAVIFDNLVRGEFHFHSVSEMTITEQWRGVLTFPTLEATLLVDKSGRLAAYLKPIIGPPLRRDSLDTIQHLVHNFVNVMWFGFNVLHRGELARALEMLGVLHRYLLCLARLVENKTDHWFIPSRAAEDDLSPEAYERFRSCTAVLDNQSLGWAYHQSWAWGGEMIDLLAERYDLESYHSLRQKISGRVEGLMPPSR